MSADAAAAGTAADGETSPTAGNSAVQALADKLQLPGTAGGNLASLTTAIGSLKEEQQRLKDQKKRLAKELKNAQRRKRRLKGKARQLSNEDLLAVLLMREETATGTSASAAASSAAPAAPAAEGDSRPGSSTDVA